MPTILRTTHGDSLAVSQALTSGGAPVDPTTWSGWLIEFFASLGAEAAAAFGDATFGDAADEISITAERVTWRFDDPASTFFSLLPPRSQPYRFRISAKMPGAESPQTLRAGALYVGAKGSEHYGASAEEEAVTIGETVLVTSLDASAAALAAAEALLQSLAPPPLAYYVSSSFAGLAVPYVDEVDVAVTDALAAIAAGATIVDVYLLDAGAALPAGETWQTLRSNGVRVHAASDVDRTHALEMLLLQGTYDEAIAPFALDESTLQLSITL